MSNETEMLEIVKRRASDILDSVQYLKFWQISLINENKILREEIKSLKQYIQELEK
jgi:hypothetical protein